MVYEKMGMMTKKHINWQKRIYQLAKWKLYIRILANDKIIIREKLLMLTLIGGWK
jgi:hypothetical protein